MLLITHRHLGVELLETATSTLGLCPLQTRSLEVFAEDDPQILVTRAVHLLREADAGDGVLVLTDAYGSTPGNVAVAAAEGHAARVVSGLNLPMLLRVLNYPDRPLAELARAAAEGGRNGILDLGEQEPLGS
nr:PTS fructose transporter subunit IIA [Halorhodospira abdelmalekii]